MNNSFKYHESLVLVFQTVVVVYFLFLLVFLFFFFSGSWPMVMNLYLLMSDLIFIRTHGWMAAIEKKYFDSLW
jgi:hypothetical protein